MRVRPARAECLQLYCIHTLGVILLLATAPQNIGAEGGTARSLLQGPAPFATLGPQPALPGLSVEAVIDLWGVGLLPFGPDVQQTLLDTLNETVVDVEKDELQLLAVEELLPLSGPQSISVNGNKAQNGSSGPLTSPAPSPSSAGRRLLTGPRRKLLQNLASAGNSDNLQNLPHLEVRVRVSSAPGGVKTIEREIIAAVNGPLLPALNQRGVNVTYVMLKSLSLNYGNRTTDLGSDLGSSDSTRPGRLSSAAIGLIIAAAVLAALLGFGTTAFLIWRRRKLQRRQSEKPLSSIKSLPDGSLTSVQADSVHAPPSVSLSEHPSILLSAGSRALLHSHSGSLISSKGSDNSSQSRPEKVGAEAPSADLDSVLYEVPFSELQFSRVIGEGSFGRVFLGKWRETTVAIKILNAPSGGAVPDECWDIKDLSKLKDASWSERQQGPTSAEMLLVKELRKEASLMAGLRHPNIVMFLGVTIEPPCMITEFCARGSLLDVLRRARTNKAVAMELDWRRRLRLLLDAAKGMFYLHSRQPQVLHRDLKSANLLVDKHWQVKVADFNLSRVMHSSTAVSSMAATNPRWLPPEVLTGNGYGATADVYAFGIIMWELLTWRVPWEDDTPWQVVISVVDHDQRPAFTLDEGLPGGLPTASSLYLEVMKCCWATKPEERLNFSSIINHVRTLIEAEDLSVAQRASGNGTTVLAGTVSEAQTTNDTAQLPGS